MKIGLSKQQKKSAQKIIEEYKKGERNFRELDLRGESFAGYNLSGADFTSCDLRGANLTKAILEKAIFRDINKAGSENDEDETKYTWFFVLLVVGVVVIITVIILLLNSRQGELVLINKYANSFLSLALLVPAGYYIHLSQSGTKIAYFFWGGGIISFLLKTLEQPLWELLGNLLFLVLAASLVLPLYMFAKKFKSSRDWGKLVINSPIFIILSFLSISFVLFFFVPLNSSAIFSFLSDIFSFFGFYPERVTPENSLLTLSISKITLSLPAIPSLFFPLAAYSILFDANKTYKNIFKALFQLVLFGLALLIGYVGTQEFFNEVGIFWLIILILLILALQLIIFIFSQLLQAKKLIPLKWLLWLFFFVSLNLFWLYYSYSDKSSTIIIKDIMQVFLFSLFVRLTWNFSTLSFRSKWSAKLLAWWCFFSLALPASVISMSVIASEGFFSFVKLSLFFVSVLIIWFSFLLSVSVFDLNNLGVRLIDRIKNRKMKSFLHCFWFTLLVLLRSYLILVAFSIILFFINWLEYGAPPDISYFESNFFLFFALLAAALVFILFVLAFIFWLVLLLTKSKITKTKQRPFPIQKIKSQYSGFRDLAVSFRCINSTNFGQANLIEADFSNANVKGVNFRGAKLKGTIWTDAKGLECAAIGNTYLKYPKVRNLVVQVRNSKKV